MRDLSSDRRIKLLLETNVRQMANRGYQLAGQSDFALFAWPCYELVRIYPRRVPRGDRVGKDGAIVDDPGESWPERWERVGGQFYDGRMIARKDDPIWGELGSSANFPDALDTDVPPFAFGSGYGWRSIEREEAIALGVIDEDTDIEGRSSERAAAMEVAADFDPEFLKSLREGLSVEVKEARAILRAAEDLSAPAKALAPVADFGRIAHNADPLAHNAGTSDGAQKGWITRRQGKLLAGQAFDDATAKGGHAMAPRAYLRVDSGGSARIKRQTGLDVTGYEHAIDGASVRHILGQHGDVAAEAKRGQIAITRADFVKLPIIVSKPDTIRRGKKTKQGLDTIEYTRRVGSETFVVEEVRTGSKQLVPKTLYKK